MGRKWTIKAIKARIRYYENKGLSYNAARIMASKPKRVKKNQGLYQR